MNLWLAELARFFMHFGVFGLFLLSFAEASFFPVPPYLLSIPMTLANPRLGFEYAFIATLGSVLGGLFGYALGVRLGRPLLIRFVDEVRLKRVEGFYHRYGNWATVIGGLTPIPYKIFAIAAGVFRTRLAGFIPASIFARGIRFFIEAILLIRYGRGITKLLQTTFSPVHLIWLLISLTIIFLFWKTGLKNGIFLRFMRNLVKKWLSWAERLRRNYLPAGMFGWYLITGACLTGFGFMIFTKLASELLERELTHFDTTIRAVIIAFRTAWLTWLMRGITNLGSTGWIIGLLLVLLGIGFRIRRRLEVLVLNLSVGGALLLSELLKISFHRHRPDLPWLTSANGYSFPSGHSLISMALYGFLAYLVFRNSRRPGLNRVIGIGLVLLPVLIGISRVYLGVHYPSDVLAGWSVGLAWVGTCIVGMESLATHLADLPPSGGREREG